MKILGLEIRRTEKQISPAESSWLSGWYPLVREPFAGAWQRNMEARPETLLAFSTVFACVTMISSDIAKMWLRLMEQDPEDGIWTEVPKARSTPWQTGVMKRPNRYSNRIVFFQHWLISKLTNGNTYALKQRDRRGVVEALYILDPSRVRPLIGPDGAVYYQLYKDNLANIERDTVAPQDEIIHDIMYPLFHPLIGVSPIFAAANAAMQGLKIQSNSLALFANNSNPGGVLTAPGTITAVTAERIKTHWEQNYGGPQNIGAVAVLGDGLKYEPMIMKAVDAQLIEQLKWTGENVCSAFHVPPYRVGIGVMPTYNNIQALTQQYYGQCLQILIEALELCLDEGLELGRNSEKKTYGTEFDVDSLLRMDTATAVEVAQKKINAGFATPNEVRRDFELKPIDGGDTPYMQNQYWPLDQLASREIPDPGAANPQNQLPPKPADDNVIDAEPVEDDDVKMIGVERMAEIVMREELTT